MLQVSCICGGFCSVHCVVLHGWVGCTCVAGSSFENDQRWLTLYTLGHMGSCCWCCIGNLARVVLHAAWTRFVLLLLSSLAGECDA